MVVWLYVLQCTFCCLVSFCCVSNFFHKYTEIADLTHRTMGDWWSQLVSHNRSFKIQLMSKKNTMTTTTKERAPDSAPLPLFFLPNFVGLGFAILLERFDVETKLVSSLTEASQPYGLLGLGIFFLFNVNSYLAGCVVRAKAKFNVKNPDLYAHKSEHKHAVDFNVIQRGHQNFLEQLPQTSLSIATVAFLAQRPNLAGLQLLVIGVARIFYAIGYRSADIENRIGPMLISQFTLAIGIGYVALIGMSVLGLKCINSQ